MKTILTSLMFIMSFVPVANAQPCSLRDAQEINSGLLELIGSNRVSETHQEEANFARSLLNHDLVLLCDLKSGIVGKVFDIRTRTHTIHISFAGRQITNLAVTRLGFH